MARPDKKNRSAADIELPDIDASQDIPAIFKTDEDHDALLEYLESRLNAGQKVRPGRLARYARIDRTVSTWQALSVEDSKRRDKQDQTGNAQALHMNLPLIHTHAEDMASFYTNIYSPASGSFYQLPTTIEQKTMGEKLVVKLNQDAEASCYFSELSRAMRSFIKYNISGFALQWGNEDLTQIDDVSSGMNHTTAVDMYNILWDPEIKEPKDISCEAEWAAIVTHKTRRWLIRREKSAMFVGVGRVFPDMIDGAQMSNGNAAKFYRYSPAEAGVTSDDSVAATPGGTVDWTAYGASLEGDDSPTISGHEVIQMYCWLNPFQFGLVDSDPQDYQLWQFYIVDMKAIVYAKQVKYNTESADTEHEIPIYMGYMSQDEMGSQQRSTAELMAPFQNFASFLVNAHVSGTRSSIWGLQGYDPNMFDMGDIPEGATSARLKSKVPGRDVRAGLVDLRGQIDTSQTMQSLSALMSLMQQFFPAQALPSQIAGMDRAVTSQVSAVMQGVNRRMHMIVRVLDVTVFSRMSQGLYKNIAFNSDANLTGLSDSEARQILGTGLMQLNLEQAEAAFRQLLFAVMQNPELAQNLNVLAMITFWGTLLNLPIPVELFANQQQPPAGGAPQNDQGTQPGGPPSGP